MAGQPVTSQPHGGNATQHLTNFDKDWHSGLFSSMLDCPDSAIACCCCCWYVGLVAERAGESFWAGCCNAPIALLAVRSKVRGAFRIRGNLCYDQCISSCCCQCASMQTKHELDYQGVSGLGPRWLGNKS
ncbi:unnamed protein product [Rotaria sordida]|uniref:Uncharacterized protein n=1 Tax=Rotaria sordida TaxID=392033 RepID=A0A819JZH8_9BILA|nr:unnamed protein product [Rotaria sordida]CAF1171171.1 unnamed protein product [Rotaria sordida]CAF1234851.1 unnamed protein product [Rotaria sordida]CAF1271516.1 unnamed protein product [Rotaria sordida]CAF3847995.1 unnamed protein product [Rotaria sordida]